MYLIGGEKLPAPAAGIWLNMARFVTGGSLPPKALPFAASLAAVAAILVVFEDYVAGLEKRGGGGTWAGFCKAVKAGAPSGVGIAVGMYVKPMFTLPRVLGSILEGVWAHAAPGGHK